jgi:YafQ family addiction module toxin component
MQYEIKPNLKRLLKKILKKDKVLYNQTIKKIQEIIESKNIDHYKNLKNPLQEYKRIHIIGPFVLIFKYLKKENKLIFCELNHHDNIYK